MFLRLQISLKSGTVVEVGSALESCNNNNFSYLDDNRLRFGPISFKSLDIREVLGL